jgi:hypothetical protein
MPIIHHKYTQGLIPSLARGQTPPDERNCIPRMTRPIRTSGICLWYMWERRYFKGERPTKAKSLLRRRKNRTVIEVDYVYLNKMQRRPYAINVVMHRVREINKRKTLQTQST